MLRQLQDARPPLHRLTISIHSRIASSVESPVFFCLQVAPLLKRLQNVWARSTHAHSHSNRSRTTHCEDFVSCPPKSPVCCRLGYKTGSTETAVFLSLLSSPTRGLGFDPKPLQTSTRLGPDS